MFCQIAGLGRGSAWTSQTGSSRTPCGCLESQLPNQFQRPRTRHEGGYGIYVLQTQILADKQQHRLAFRVCSVGCCDCVGKMLMSRLTPGNTWSNCNRCDIGAWTIGRSLNRDNFNHNCHNASGDNGWSMTVARMLVIPLRQRTTHFQ